MEHLEKSKEEAFEENLFVFEDDNFDETGSQNSKKSNNSFKNEFYS